MEDTEETPKAGSPGDDSQAERRGQCRRRMFKGAKVLLNEHSSVINCVVKDLSATGARLFFQNFQPLPQRFKLVINELGAYDCEIVRLHNTEYGVRFIPKR